MNDELILVDILGSELGHASKENIHKQGLLHRAFSVFILSEDKMLLQRRQINKYHSGGLWTNACCSHPRLGESLETAVQRRLMEELGISCPTKEILHGVYRYPFENGITEYEYDHVFIGSYSGPVLPDSGEVSELRWASTDEIKEELIKNPSQFTCWFLIFAPQIIEILNKNQNEFDLKTGYNNSSIE